MDLESRIADWTGFHPVTSNTQPGTVGSVSVPTSIEYPATSDQLVDIKSHFLYLLHIMGNFRAIWKHEVRQANQISRVLIQDQKVKLDWRVLLLPFFCWTLFIIDIVCGFFEKIYYLPGNWPLKPLGILPTDRNRAGKFDVSKSRPRTR